MHKCRSYFNITSDKEINIDVVCDMLTIDRDEIILSKNSNSININLCEEYNIDTNILLRKTLSNLFGKEDILRKLKEKYNFTYYLERVVEFDSRCDEPTPILGLARDIIEFLYKSGTLDDIDYYI